MHSVSTLEVGESSCVRFSQEFTMPDMTVLKGIGHRMPRMGMKKGLLLLWFAVACVICLALSEAVTPKETILFRRVGKLWIVESDGTHQRQLTKVFDGAR